MRYKKVNFAVGSQEGSQIIDSNHPSVEVAAILPKSH
jgi:hypothetical protein